MAHTDEPVSVPLNYPTSTIFIDESGSAPTANKFFVVAGIKVRETGRLARSIRAVRDRTGYTSELKFSEITRATVPVYGELISALEASDAHIAACVVRGDVYNPFKQRKRAWQVHADVITQLLLGSINRRELVGVCLDAITTPPEWSLEDTVRVQTNRRLGSTAVVSAVCLDSKSNDLLQLADMVAGSILWERRRAAAGDKGPRSNKGRVALRLATAFESPGLADGHEGRVRIATYRKRPTARDRLRVVDRSSHTG